MNFQVTATSVDSTSMDAEVNRKMSMPYLITTTITISSPEETMAECIGFPAVPEGSPSSLLRYWSPSYVSCPDKSIKHPSGMELH